MRVVEFRQGTLTCEVVCVSRGPKTRLVCVSCRWYVSASADSGYGTDVARR